MFHMNIHIRIILMYTVLDCLSHAACTRITAACSGCIMERGLCLIFGQVNFFCIEHCLQLFIGYNEVYIASNSSSGSFQLLGCTWSDKYHSCIRMLFLDGSCSCHHRSQFLGDLIDQIREIFLCQHGPGRAAGSQQER